MTTGGDYWVTGDKRFTSRILPPYMRRSPKVAEVLPILYLRGLSTGDVREALPVLLGDDAAGLSATNIARLTAVWEDEYRQFRQRDLADRDYVYVWVDGLHFNIRLEDDRLCTLVVIGARADGTKELVALEDGYRESAESWAELLRGLQRRGLEAPVVEVGDGALGFWSAVRDVWPQTAEQRDWFHKLENVLDKLPKRLQPKAKRALHDILAAETREQAEEHLDTFVAEYEAKYPKAAACLATDREARQLAAQCPPPLDVQRLVNRLVRDPHRFIVGILDPEPMGDLLRAPRCRPMSVLAAAMTSTTPGAHVWARHGRPVLSHHCACEAVLHVAPQPIVRGQLGYLRVLGTSGAVPLRSRRPIRQTAAPSRRVAT